MKKRKKQNLKKINNLPTIEKYKAYPTSFKEKTTIEFSINLDQKLKIQVHNIWGQLVEIIEDRNFQQGNHSLNWEANNLVVSQVNYDELGRENFLSVFSKKSLHSQAMELFFRRDRRKIILTNLSYLT